MTFDRPTPKDKWISLRVQPDLYLRIADAADADERSISSWIRHVLKATLAEEATKGAR